MSGGFVCILYVFLIVICLSSFEHGGLGAIGNVHPTPFLIPIALLLWTQKTAISASLARSDRIKPNCMTPDLASICIHCCRPDWMSKANNKTGTILDSQTSIVAASSPFLCPFLLFTKAMHFSNILSKTE